MGDPKAAMDRAARRGESPDQVRKAGQRAADMPFFLILAVLGFFVVIFGFWAAGLLGG